MIPPSASGADDDAIAGEALFPGDRLALPTALAEAQAAVGAALGRLALQPAGLDASLAELLVLLSTSPSCGIRGVEIGEHCLMTATRVSRLVDRAEATGLVERQPDPRDRRAQHVRLTPAGRAAARRYAPLMSGVLDDLVHEALTPGEHAALVELLHRIRDVARARSRSTSIDLPGDGLD